MGGEGKRKIEAPCGSKNKKKGAWMMIYTHSKNKKLGCLASQSFEEFSYIQGGGVVHYWDLFLHLQMSGSKKWPDVTPAAGYRKTTTSNNAGPTSRAESVATLDPLANPYLASGGTALESQREHLKKAQTVDKSKPVVRGEHDGAAEERSAAKASAVLDAQKGQLKKAETVDKSKPIVKGEQDKDAEVLFKSQ